MGPSNRNIAVKSEGHEIALSARIASMDSASTSTSILRFHIKGELAQSADIPFLAALPNIEIILRGRLPPSTAEGPPQVVKARCKLGFAASVVRKSLWTIPGCTVRNGCGAAFVWPCVRALNDGVVVEGKGNQISPL